MPWSPLRSTCVPGLVVAGDVIYNGVHMYLGQSAAGGFGPCREAIDKVEALGPRHIVCGHLATVTTTANTAASSSPGIVRPQG